MFFPLLTILCLLLAVAPAMADTLYDNGPYNGTTDAWLINFGYAVSNSFRNSSWYLENIDGFHFVYWDASTSDVLTTVDMSIGSTSFGANYALYQADYSFGPIWWFDWYGANYVTLQNACTTSGCSVDNPIYWDENSGPSTAYQNTNGSIPSEAFTITGEICWDCYPHTPEPSSILLFGSGVLGIVGILRRKLGR
jgi:hypothetical protein